MKNLTVIIALMATTFLTAQDQYTKGMQKAFQLWGEGKNTEASNLFERIATAELDNWLPFYYVSQVNTVASFGEKDKSKLTQQLEKAQEYIDMAKNISPNNPEILVQQAMIHTAWVAYDGATYGMTLAPKVVSIYAKAAKIAPDNPRVVFSKAEWDMGSASYFGGDITPYCKDVERAIELFDNFKPASEFHPNWGKDRAEATLKRCNK
ncbi:hypothetical protein ACEZ3G_12555 [Maribacter algicola]|uniref:Uncharacterized protein n=1 Tax=Meishania litoralis TaxID=3434685 RepID=A0ACC7LMQ6_9FLAO